MCRRWTGIGACRARAAPHRQTIHLPRRPAGAARRRDLLAHVVTVVAFGFPQEYGRRSRDRSPPREGGQRSSRAGGRHVRSREARHAGSSRGHWSNTCHPGGHAGAWIVNKNPTAAPPVSSPGGVGEDAPWISSAAQLDRLAIDGPGAVVLNHPRGTYHAVPLGEALHHVLEGRTHSFSVLVGYFAHAPVGPTSRQTNLFDPARLIEDELGETDGDAEATAFRLLFGRVGTPFSSLTLRSWYWMCRWRSSGAKKISDEWRAAALAAFHVARRDSSDINQAAVTLLDNGPTSLPILRIPREHVASALGLEGDGDGAGCFEEWQSEIHRLQAGPAREALAVFLAYLLQRRGGVKVEASAEVRLFHPKIYVIERPADSWVIGGSSNWSQPAFGGYAGENAEISTMHRTRVNAWSCVTPTGDALGPRLATTAARLFADAQLLASWDDGVHRDVSIAHAAMRSDEVEHPAPPASAAAPLRADPKVAYVLRRLVEDTLGLSGKEVQLSGQLLEQGTWGGRTPSRYQIDAAVRLVAMLEGAGERGAFLTDEAGLGKTIVAQLTAATLIARRLVERAENNDLSPLYVSILAPARLVGVDAGSGWKAASREIVDAVARVLKYLEPTRHGELLRLLKPLEMSAQSLSRRPFKSDEPGPGDRANSDVLDDFTHLALSEIVIIDEAHNFRNGNAASTRTLRLLLSLPVPGELGWPIDIGTPSSAPSNDAEMLTARGPYRRSVLCLSATPFNNRLDDLVTQIGHFARRPSWRSLDRGPVSPRDFATARDDWAARRFAAPTTEDRRAREIVELVLRAGARHLRSGRRLDPDERRAEARALGGSARGAPRESDGGPSYAWGSRYGELEQTFAAVSEWLDKYLAGEADEDQTTLARGRIDGLLVRLVVQRSRGRIIRMLAQSTTTEDPPERVFRAPWLPRHPLPIDETAEREQADDGETLEAEVLRDLYAVLAGIGSEVGEPRGRLTLFAYELGVHRGRSGRHGGSEAEVIRNAIGFQLALLIKRLQSSPYAFLRTIIRGPLRRALLEMAAVAAAAKRAPKGSDLAQAGRTVGKFERALRSRLIRQGVEKTLPALMGGTWSESGLGALLGADQPGSAVARDLQTIAAMLVTAAAEPKDTRPAWVGLLLTDIERGERGSRLWSDVGCVLDWVVGPDGRSPRESGSALLDYLYAGLPAHRGLPMRDLRRSVADGTIDSVSTLEWLRHRLVQDRRARSWLGFVLALHVAHQGGHKNAPGGARALVFTDYTDTQDYLTAVATALGHGMGARSSGGHAAYRRELLERLAGAMVAVADTLEQKAADVRATPADDGTRPADFRAPIDGAWLREWVARARKENWAPLATACEEAAAKMAAISSHGAYRVLQLAVDAPDAEADGDGEVEDPDSLPTTTVSDDPVLDAFSPWYQVAPALSIDPSGARERLRAAVANPVHVLVATEVLAEGVNLQECGIVVHYDLPWNPTRLIQRNGRVDRRIDPRFEDEGQRIVIGRSLRIPEAEAAEIAASYVPPSQVFHLTVPPVEPATVPGEGEQPAERVRRILGHKLRTIRALFGLTSWPIVLGRDEAAAVLGGQLDFETPGFRRRENLFEAWRALSNVSGSEILDRLPATLVLNVSEPAFDALALAIAGGRAREWERVTAVSVGTWSVQAESGVPVRSWPDWEHRPKLPRRTAAISGTLLLRDPAELVAWTIHRVQSGTQTRFLFRPAAWALPRASGKPRPFEFSFRGEASLRLDPMAPASPTALVEDILVAAVAACSSSTASLVPELWPAAVARRIAEPDVAARRLLVEPVRLDGALERTPALPVDLVPRSFNLWLLRGSHD